MRIYCSSYYGFLSVKCFTFTTLVSMDAVGCGEAGQVMAWPSFVLWQALSYDESAT